MKTTKIKNLSNIIVIAYKVFPVTEIPKVLRLAWKLENNWCWSTLEASLYSESERKTTALWAWGGHNLRSSEFFLTIGLNMTWILIYFPSNLNFRRSRILGKKIIFLDATIWLETETILLQYSNNCVMIYLKKSKLFKIQTLILTILYNQRIKYTSAKISM